MDLPSKRYRIDPETKSLYKNDNKILTYDSYKVDGDLVTFIIAPPSVTVLAENIDGMDSPTTKAATVKRVSKPKS